MNEARAAQARAWAPVGGGGVQFAPQAVGVMADAVFGATSKADALWAVY
ncbi:hypothetical protein ACSVHC_09080 [Arthrobacter sp. KNU-44]